MNLENNFPFQIFSFPSLFMATLPFFGNPPYLINFFVSPHVAHFGKIISPLTKDWVKSMHIYLIYS